jgi:hypothetical protein
MNIKKLALLAILSAAPCFADDGKIYQMGEFVDFDDSQWIVLSAFNLGNRLGGDELTEAKTSEGNFIKVTYKVKNKGSSEEQIIETPKLKDSEGNEYNELDDVGMYLQEGENEMTLSQLPAHISKTFVSIYEIPAESKGQMFMARSLGMLPNYKAVSITKKKPVASPNPATGQASHPTSSVPVVNLSTNDPLMNFINSGNKNK